MNKLIDMQSKLYNTPHLIEADNFTWAEGIINAQTGPQALSNTTVKAGPQDLQFNPDTQVGMISVHGPLTYQAYEAMCGETNASYQQIQAEFDALLQAGAKTIVLDVNGPGGEAYGMMETGTYLRTKADQNNVNLIAYVDGYAASATYGITASAHEVIVNPSAEVGSIGVVVKLRNTNKAMQEMGVQDTYIYAGKSKVPFTADGSFSQDFLDGIQEKVDTLYNEFTSYVADMRGISTESVKATEAKTFLATQAIDLGLADKAMTREEFFNYLADTVQSGQPMLKNKLFPKSNSTHMSAEYMTQLEDLQKELASLSTEFYEKTTELANVMTALSEKDAALAATTQALAEANEKLSAIAEKEAEAAKAAEEAKMAARKASLVEAVGDAEAETLFESLSMLPDAAFDAVVTKMTATKADAEAKEKTNPLFKEIGKDGDRGTEVPSSLQAELERKYGKKA